MPSILKKRFAGWGCILLTSILVCWHFLFPVAKAAYHYSMIYAEAFIDTAPGIIFRDKKIEFVGSDSVTVPLKNGMTFIFNSSCDSSILADKAPGSVAVSHNNILIRLEKHVQVLQWGAVNVDHGDEVIRPESIRAAVLGYSGWVIAIVFFIVLCLSFLCFLLLSLTAAGVCSIIDSIADTTLNFSIFFHLAGIILPVCAGFFIMSHMAFHQTGIMVLIFLIICIIFCFVLIKQNEKPQLSG